MQDIPIIDLGLADHGGEGELAVAMQIDRACREVGFFTVRGHCIPLSLLENAYCA